MNSNKCEEFCMQSLQCLKTSLVAWGLWLGMDLGSAAPTFP